MIFKFMLERFVKTEMKIDSKQWQKVEIDSIVHMTRDESDIMYVEFKNITDIAVFNSNLRNLNNISSNKLFQYVPNTLKQIHSI